MYVLKPLILKKLSHFSVMQKDALMQRVLHRRATWDSL